MSLTNNGRGIARKNPRCGFQARIDSTASSGSTSGSSLAASDSRVSSDLGRVWRRSGLNGLGSGVGIFGKIRKIPLLRDA